MIALATDIIVCWRAFLLSLTRFFYFGIFHMICVSVKCTRNVPKLANLAKEFFCVSSSVNIYQLFNCFDVLFVVDSSFIPSSFQKNIGHKLAFRSNSLCLRCKVVDLRPPIHSENLLSYRRVKIKIQFIS